MDEMYVEDHDNDDPLDSRQAYVGFYDCDIRIVVRRMVMPTRVSTQIVSYEPEGDLEFAKKFLAAWTKAIEIAERWDKEAEDVQSKTNDPTMG